MELLTNIVEDFLYVLIFCVAIYLYYQGKKILNVRKKIADQKSQTEEFPSDGWGKL